MNNLRSFSFASPGRIFLFTECALLFIGVPVFLYMTPTRLSIHLSLWIVTAYAAFILSRTPGFSWKKEWQGGSLTSRDFKFIAARFLVSTLSIFLLTLLIEPDRLFSFPAQRPFFWLIVMILYPLLSALPQELVFRSFFFRRYEKLFPDTRLMLLVSSFAFGFIHIVFHNPVSPLLSVICGFYLAGSYMAHRSLKKAALEHALYGDMVFTVGLGMYFLVHNM